MLFSFTPRGFFPIGSQALSLDPAKTLTTADLRSAAHEASEELLA